MKPSKFLVAVWTHRHGADVSLFSTMERVEKFKDNIGRANWNHELHYDMPHDHVGDAYFNTMQESGEEFFEVHECELDKMED